MRALVLGIGLVLGMVENKKAELLNSKAAKEESKAGEVIAALRLERGMRVADIGAGGGYFSLMMAEAVGKGGKVYIVDTDQKHLDFSSERAKEKGIMNAAPVLAHEANPNLPENGVDLIFMRLVCHHMKNRAEYFAALKPCLAPGGRVAAIDYPRGSFWSFRWLKGHYAEAGDVEKEMEKAGFVLVQKFDFLPRQWFMVFSLPTAREREEINIKH